MLDALTAAASLIADVDPTAQQMLAAFVAATFLAGAAAGATVVGLLGWGLR
jgi:hypothetical protein